ncbi:MAG: PhzF family phenazine biosynthesis protein [Acidimicrobiia bacterium]|nr:PhzF family phenazine biosynthesis protein [Acidimicrobiia bacterium]
MARPCHVLRVFTRDGVGGNALGVVNDPVGLDTAKMQQIAADLGFSETTFVEWPPGSDPVVRIFTPTAEMPFAGHPMVGTAWVFHHLGPGGVDHLRCQTGAVAIRSDESSTWIELDPLGKVIPVPDLADQLRSARIPQPARSWLVEMPLEYLILDLGDSAAVRDLDVDFDALDQFGTYVFARDGSTVHARFFAPGHGVPEDPATGSAAVALAAALSSSGEESGHLTILQGEEVGNPSQIELHWTPQSVSIGGGVVRDEVRLLNA